MFGWFRKKTAQPKSPLQVYDDIISAMERQSAQYRKSAATLMALRATLTRESDEQRRRCEALEARLDATDDQRARKVLQGDVEAARKTLAAAVERLSVSESDAEALLEGAKAIGTQLEALKAERRTASMKIEAGGAITEAMQARVEHFERVVALDAARDEIERAHALAELAKEDALAK